MSDISSDVTVWQISGSNPAEPTGFKSSTGIYTLLGSREIRLLAFDQSTADSSTLSCKLSTVTLDQHPDFDAISYAWSNADYAYEIVCNGVAIKIHSNLYH